ncbi:uncharacterized protein FA14DRAFT_162245 [Meira miltonrushii]|uniref:sterol 3beta-glucosyltransferase n=1 Tax=Meira miltonrushii TaxID=1280837 RepID=A0A316V346_9BASI|nr:uncharacterized protein FA14DRAFT_162245 [Meira miltonrushii]PWN31882.1 hypothetical protein FA14DRAFT_162245 [Meira miltonrushii]
MASKVDTDKQNQMTSDNHQHTSQQPSERPPSPPLLKPQPRRPSPKAFEQGSYDDINTSLSFLIREAAQMEDDRRKAKSRQSQKGKQGNEINRAKSPLSSQKNAGLTPLSASHGKPPFNFDRDENAKDTQTPTPIKAPFHLTDDVPDRTHAQSTPPFLNRPDTPSSVFKRPSSPFQRAKTPAFLQHHNPSSDERHTPFPEHQKANLLKQMESMSSSTESDEGTRLLQRIRKASSARSRTPAPTSAQRPSSVAPFYTNLAPLEPIEREHDASAQDASDHLFLKGDEKDDDVLSAISRTSSHSSESTNPVPLMSDEEKLEAIVEEFGPAPEIEDAKESQKLGKESVLGSQAAVLVRRVLIRGYLVLTTHRLCFIALLPASPTKHRILQQGPAIIHRPGLTKRKRKAWFTLTSENIIAYPSSTELYEPLGGARLIDIDDVQPSPHEKAVHFRVRGKKVSLEFETSEAAMAWQREIDAAIFMSTHNFDKIRLCIPLVRIAQLFFTDFLDISTMVHVDVLDVDAPQHRIPRLHRSDRDPHSTTDVLFALVNDAVKMLPHLQPALKRPAELRANVEKSLWYTLPTALIDIDGPRAQSEDRESNKTETGSENASGPHSKAAVFLEQFSLDCSIEEINTFKVHLVRTLPLAGTLAITPRHLCFYRRHRWTGLADTRIRIPFRDIKGAEQTKAFSWHYSGLRIHVLAHEDIVMEIKDEGQREEIMQAIKKKVEEQGKEASKTNKPTKVQEKDPQLDPPTVGGTQHKVQKQPSTQTDILALQDRSKTITLKPSQINIAPRTINMDRSVNVTVAPMKIHCLTIGSRGDVQPYVALCKRLQKDFHTCTIVSHEEYREWVEGNGIAFRAVGGDPGELMKLSVDNNKMLFSPQFYREAMGKFRHWLDELLRGIMETCWDADLIIESPSTFGGIHVAEAIGSYYMRAFTMPWTRTSTYPQAFSVPNVDLGPQYNSMSYTIFDQVLWLASSGQINRWRRHMLHLESTDLNKLDQGSVPFMYNFSPAVVPPPLDWGDRIKVTGYWNLTNDATKWEAPKELLTFIQKAKDDNKKLCYIGFGSITMSDPIGVQRNIYEAIRRSDVRAVVAKGWSGRMIAKKEKEGEVDLPEVPKEAYVVDSIPHEWLFPRIDIAMHHGGAGTTGASLRAGLVTLIHPFFGDQYFWSGRVAKLGAGVRVKSLSVDDITEALTRARDETLLREKAQVVGEMIRKEKGLDVARDFIYQSLERSKRVKRALGGNKKQGSISRSNTIQPLDEKRTSTFRSNTSEVDESSKDSPDSSPPSKGREVSRTASSMERLIRHGSLSVKHVASMMHLRSPPRSNTNATTVSESTSPDHDRESNESGRKSKVHDHTPEQEPVVLTDEPETMTDSEDKDPIVDQAHAPEELHTKSKKSWYNYPVQHMPGITALNMPSLSMPHMNFFDVRLHGIHLSHRGHAESASGASKVQMTEQEKEHAQKEEKQHHLNARQEDQKRRQLLEKEWRKAGRFDLLGSDSSMNIQPEEDESEEGDENARESDDDSEPTEQTTNTQQDG